MDKEEVIYNISNCAQFNTGVPSQRAAEIAQFCSMVSAGIGENEYVAQLRPNEDHDQKAQRVRVYHTLSGYAAGSVIEFIHRLSSVEDVKKRIGLVVPDAKKQELIEGIVNNFYDEKTLLDWIVGAYAESQSGDPNELILLTDYQVTDVNNAAVENRVIPSIIKSSSVLKKTNVGGRVNSVITTQQRSIQFNTQKKVGYGKPIMAQRTVSDYYFYGDNLQMIFIYDESQLNEGISIDLPPFALRSLPYESLPIEKEAGETEYYKVYTFPTNTPCPVFSISGRKDKKDPSVFTSILMSAEAQFRALIARVSELGVAINCHIFPQKFIIVPTCRAKDPQTGESCNQGVCGSKKCEACKGTGKLTHLSSQDVVHITIPEGMPASEIPNIANMVYFAPHDQYAPEFLRQEIDTNLVRIGDATFKTNIFGNTVVASKSDKSATSSPKAETATKTNIDWQKMYMALKLDAQQVEKLWAWITTYIARANFSGIELNPVCSFPKDFDFLTVPELIVEYKAAVDAGLPYSIIQKIMQKIIEKQTPDDTLAVQWELFNLHHKPFADKSAQEVATIVSMRDGLDFDRVLWENFDSIMDMVRIDNPNILVLDFKKQLEIIKKATMTYAEGIVYVQPQDMNNLFGGTPQ
jgi:hypothetical protein